MKEKTRYIVELEPGVYIAPWHGDPGRTLKVDSAAKFNTPRLAKVVLRQARLYRPFENAEIIPITDRLN